MARKRKKYRDDKKEKRKKRKSWDNNMNKKVKRKSKLKPKGVELTDSGQEYVPGSSEDISSDEAEVSEYEGMSCSSQSDAASAEEYAAMVSKKIKE